MNPNKGKDQVLFTTVTGSHMWEMETKDSDLDISTCYIRNSEDFLIKGVPQKGVFKCKQQFDENGKPIDEQIYEICKLIKLLLTGNINALWAVFSPKKRFEHRNVLKELKQIVKLNFSKSIYHSCLGVAKSDIKRFITKGDPESLLYKKKLNVVGRNLYFGINLLTYNEAIFAKVDIKSLKEIENLIIRLNKAFEASLLPDKVNPEPFEKFLLKWRLKKLKIDEMI